jgi:adenylate kinase family enzyme
MENEGIAGLSCRHFDFGEEMRQAAALGEKGPLSGEALRTVLETLKTGALLEKETFDIAETLFRRFIRIRRGFCEEIVILNGLPRHLDQAVEMDRLVRIERIVVLKCTARVVLERIRANAGGDRALRDDDTLEEVSRRLERYRTRTRPLIRYYRRRNLPVITVEVRKETRPDQIIRTIKSTGLFNPQLKGQKRS